MQAKRLAYEHLQHLDIHPVDNLFSNLSFQSSSCINFITGERCEYIYAAEITK